MSAPQHSWRLQHDHARQHDRRVPPVAVPRQSRPCAALHLKQGHCSEAILLFCAVQVCEQQPQPVLQATGSGHSMLSTASPVSLAPHHPALIPQGGWVLLDCYWTFPWSNGSTSWACRSSSTPHEKSKARYSTPPGSQSQFRLFGTSCVLAQHTGRSCSRRHVLANTVLTCWVNLSAVTICASVCCLLALQKFPMDFLAAARPQTRTTTETMRMLGMYGCDSAVAQRLGVHIPHGCSCASLTRQ